MAPRRAARVLVVNEEEQVLLLLHARPQDDQHWAPAGGGLEVGETPLDAAARELAEETGLRDVTITGPHWLWQHHFSYYGTRIEQHEALFLARVTAWLPQHPTHHQAVDGIAACRWWSARELIATHEDVWPHGLPNIMATINAPPVGLDAPKDLGLTTSR